MRTTIQRNFRKAAFSIFLLLSPLGAAGQGTFQNLGFENTILTVFERNPSIPSYATNATVPGWDWSPHGNAGYGDPNTTVSFNDIALDAPAVTLHGTNSFRPAIRGSYSILLQGGTTAGGLATGNTNGASVFQTGQIPADSLSLIYLGGGAVRVSFNGQTLPRIAVGSTANSTIWGADISGYAGQSGELRFTAPWLSTGMLDSILFSPTAIPEPSVLVLSAIFVLCLFRMMKRPNRIACTVVYRNRFSNDSRISHHSRDL
jgi:hypothetical protein